MTTLKTPRNETRQHQPVDAWNRRRALSRRLRLFILNGALVLTGAGVGILAAEITVRMLQPQQLIMIRPDIWQPSDVVGWAHSPNLATRVNTGERTVSFFTDHRGYRVPAARDAGSQHRILLLGDSFMEALQVEYEQSLAGMLESRLSSLLGGPVVVDNTAVGGWSPSQYLIQAKNALQRDDYDYVVVGVYLGNDIILEAQESVPAVNIMEEPQIRFPRSMSRSELISAILYPANQYLEATSHLYVLAKTRTNVLRKRLGLTAVYFPVEHLVAESTSLRWSVTAGILSAISQEAAEHNVPALFVLIPSDFQVHEEIMDAHVRGFGLDPSLIDLDQPNRLMTEQLRFHGLNFVDPLGEMRRQSAGIRLYGRVDTHLTPEGHSIITDVVAPVIAEHLRRSDR